MNISCHKKGDYLLSDLVAFYLTNGYSRYCLLDYLLRNHINSAIDVFNCRCDISRLIPKIKEISKIKYNLIIVKDNNIHSILLKIKTMSVLSDRVLKILVTNDIFLKQL